MERCNPESQQFFILPTFMSLDKIKYWKDKRAEPADQDLLHRYTKMTSYHPHQEEVRTVPKFQRVLSSSQINQLSHRKKEVNRESKSYSNLKLYNKLNHKLDEIKETLKQSLVSVGHRRQKNPVRRKEQIVTEVSERKHQGKDSTKKYYDVLKHIAQVRSKNRKGNIPEQDPKMPSIPGTEERTLFYGIEFIDGIEFKIKLKLSKTHYYLFAKNNHTKVMVEIAYADYMKMHIGEFRGNPCNIFRYLTIEGDKIHLFLRNSSGKKVAPSLKSYVGYY